jgi:signal recognition particle GTPase
MSTETAPTAAEQIAEFKSEGFVMGEPVEAPPPAPPAVVPPAEPEKKPVEAKPAETPPSTKLSDIELEDSADKQYSKPVQVRINELTQKRRVEERRAEAAEARARELEARLAVPPAPVEPARPAAPPVVAADPNEPDPNSFDYGELDPKYIRALAAHEANKTFAALRKEDDDKRAAKAAEDRHIAQQAKLNKMIEAGSQEHEDYFERVIEGAEHGKYPISSDTAEMIVESDVGAQIAYHLATNLEEAVKLYEATPREQARIFGKLEAQFSAARTAAPGEIAGKPAQPRTPQAPPPPERARGAGGQVLLSADTNDFAAFEARANAR